MTDEEHYSETDKGSRGLWRRIRQSSGIPPCYSPRFMPPLRKQQRRPSG
jgi:hypothetical protein